MVAQIVAVRQSKRWIVWRYFFSLIHIAAQLKSAAMQKSRATEAKWSFWIRTIGEARTFCLNAVAGSRFV
jgi:hypothetical protein